MQANDQRGTSRETGARHGALPLHRTALITGATSGIGFELARLLAADGYDLVIVGRNQERLERVAEDFKARYHVAVRCAAADLSDPGAVFLLWSDVTGSGLTIDTLVNNAGVGLYGPVADQDPRRLQGLLQLNAGALTTLTRLALPATRDRSGDAF